MQTTRKPSARTLGQALGAAFIVGGMAAGAVTGLPHGAQAASGLKMAPTLLADRTRNAAHDVDITASEFKFAVNTHGRVPAGLVRFRLANHGTMDHQALLFKLHPGVTVARFLQALQSNFDAALALVDLSGGADTVAAGHSQVTWEALQGGNYVLLCLVSGADGVPHVAKGMLTTLTVTGHLSPAQLAALRPAGHVDGTITAHDMTYTLPRVVDGDGLYRFTDTDTKDAHELSIIRIGARTTAADIVKAIRTGGALQATSAGGFGAVIPGGGGWLRLNLPPGKYAALCFVPDDAAPHLPHAAMGMVVTFTVPKEDANARH
jgi:hypothetical protein